MKTFKLPTAYPQWGKTTGIQWNPAQGPAIWETSCYDSVCVYIPAHFHSNIFKVIQTLWTKYSSHLIKYNIGFICIIFSCFNSVYKHIALFYVDTLNLISSVPLCSKKLCIKLTPHQHYDASIHRLFCCLLISLSMKTKQKTWKPRTTDSPWGESPDTQ